MVDWCSGYHICLTALTINMAIGMCTKDPGFDPRIDLFVLVAVTLVFLLQAIKHTSHIYT